MLLSRGWVSTSRLGPGYFSVLRYSEVRESESRRQGRYSTQHLDRDISSCEEILQC